MIAGLLLSLFAGGLFGIFLSLAVIWWWFVIRGGK